MWGVFFNFFFSIFSKTMLIFILFFFFKSDSRDLSARTKSVYYISQRKRDYSARVPVGLSILCIYVPWHCISLYHVFLAHSPFPSLFICERRSAG